MHVRQLVSPMLLAGLGLGLTGPLPGQSVPAMSPAEGILPIPAGPLLVRAANPFDLEGRTLRFTPAERGYTLDVLPLEYREETGTALPPPSGAEQPVANSWTLPLPFPFPFGDDHWTVVHINSNGSLSFGRPETQTTGERSAWADGTMRAVAAALDVRSATGMEQKIAPLWALYGSHADQNRVHTRATNDEFVVTWETVRRQVPNAGYDPIGTNRFQAVVSRNGEIRFSYLEVPEVDGIVGLFPGGTEPFRPLDRALGSQSDAPPELEILEAEVAESGTLLRLSLRMARPLPDRIDEGWLVYSFLLGSQRGECRLFLRMGEAPGGGPGERLEGMLRDDAPPTGGPTTRVATSNCVGAAPMTAAYQIQGSRLDLYLSKTALDDPSDFTWRAEVARMDRGSGERSTATLGGAAGRRVTPAEPFPAGRDLASASGEVVRGNYFEVFHYPALTKRMHRVMRHIYARHPAEEEIATVFTDFRVDDLFNHGPSSRSVNVEVQGIGQVSAARPGEPFGSATLQTTHSPIFLGPRFSERVADESREYHGYAFAVGWISHELMHRWSAFLEIRHEDLDGTDALLEPCHCHWNGNLHAPSVSSIASIYSTNPYTETSPMGGSMWDRHEDGTFTRRPKPYMAPMGMSALDLYAMGLLAPEEVEDTFLLNDPRPLGGGRFRAQEVPVRITDIIAATGIRVPPSHQAQRTFRMGVYILHEDGREPDPERVRQGAEIGAAMARYFDAATGGRMEVRITTGGGGG